MKTAEYIVSVTNKEIKGSSYTDYRHCPIAKAIKKLMKPEFHDAVGVGPKDVIFTENQSVVHCHDFGRVYGYDDVMHAPFELSITIPSHMVVE